MKMSDTLYQAQRRYRKSHTKQITLTLNLSTDTDIIERLDAVDNKQGYIKQLIRDDMQKE